MPDAAENPDVSAGVSLAALLHAIAQMTGDRGRHLMERLTEVAAAGETADSQAPMPELAAMVADPRDDVRARDLAQAFLVRAAGDPAFSDALASWRGQPDIQALDRNLTRVASLRQRRDFGPPGTKHAFISYAPEDADQVDRLQDALEANRIRVWRDRDSLWPGEDWRREIRRAITGDALVFLACFSQHRLARSSSVQHEELALAIEASRTRRSDQPWLIPVRFDDCVIPDDQIRADQSLDSLWVADLFGEHLDDETARLVATVTRMLDPAPDNSAPHSRAKSVPTEAMHRPYSPGRHSERGTPRQRPWSRSRAGIGTITILGCAVVALIVWTITAGSGSAGNHPPVGSQDRSSAGQSALSGVIDWCCQFAALEGTEGYNWPNSYQSLQNTAKVRPVNLSHDARAGIGIIEVSLQTKSAEPILVSPPQIIVKGKVNSPDQGLLLLVEESPQGSGKAPQFTADLDEQDPITAPYSPPGEQHAGTANYFYVSQGSPEVFLMQVVDHHFLCHFSVKIKWQYNGHVYSKIFTNKGKLFTIGGSSGLRSIAYNPIVGPGSLTPSPLPSP